MYTSDDEDSFVFTASQERFYLRGNNKEEDENEDTIQIQVLLTTIACPVWIQMYLKCRDFELLFVRQQQQSYQISFVLITTVVLHPAENEIRIDTKQHSGSFVLRTMDKKVYEFLVEFIQTKASEVFKQIVFEYKTIEQDKQFGLLDEHFKPKYNNITTIIKVPFKKQHIHFRVLK